MLPEVDAIYERFERERSTRKPVCNASGECCRFEQYGHRLFVTGLEMARFWQAYGENAARYASAWDGLGCPFQVVGRCDTYLMRPFGCRAYFCDSTSTQWQNEQYEQFHGQIRELHQRAGVPYLYVEWREALDALGVLARQ